ncbi:hypothetical protein LguiA_032794 [Lonicera macranthoides]
MKDNVFTAKPSSSSDDQTALLTTVSCSLKRKRPPKIEIPNVLQLIPTTDANLTLQDSQAQEETTTLSFTGFDVALFSIKGKKMFMEDTHKIEFFGVYDGHGGSKAAEFVAENLDANIFQMLENFSGNSTKEEAIKAGYLKTNQDFQKQGLGSGTCCVTAVIEGKELMISNVGDCRAVLCRGGKAEALTKDHRASRDDERKRIEDKGGYVEIHRGAWRVHGILSVSRSIGDVHLKDWVIAEPDTKILGLTPDMQYLVLASDGLWEEVGNQEAVDIVMWSCLGKKKLQPNGETAKLNNDEFGCISTSPSPKLRRILLVKQKKRMGQSPVYRRKVDDGLKKNENDFGCKNESPPSKARRLSFVNQKKMKTQSSDQENSCPNKRRASGGLVAACKELANLAVSRGSFDDITVMIIDLNQYKN